MGKRLEVSLGFSGREGRYFKHFKVILQGSYFASLSFPPATAYIELLKIFWLQIPTREVRSYLQAHVLVSHLTL